MNSPFTGEIIVGVVAHSTLTGEMKIVWLSIKMSKFAEPKRFACSGFSNKVEISSLPVL